MHHQGKISHFEGAKPLPTFAIAMIMMASSFSSKPRQASMAAYRQLLAENHVEEILQDVKQNKNLDRKKELPVWLPLAAGFNNGTRKAEDAVPSGLFFLDIDEKGLTDQLWQKVQDENLIEAFRIVYFAESAGGGTHIWAWRTPGLSIEEDIQKLSSRLGVSYDSHVTDLARCCFMVSEQYVKLLDPVVFEENSGEWREESGKKIDAPTPASDLSAVSSTLDYKGITYEKIVQSLLWKLGYGDAPVEGERNMALYTMSRYLRFICDFDTIKSAVSSTRPAEMPSQMKEVLSMLGATIEVETEPEEESLIAPINEELPAILQELADHAPEEFKEATLIAAMPMLGTLATGIRAKYRDGKLNSPSFIVDIEAPQATGKSFVDAEFELLMDPIIESLCSHPYHRAQHRCVGFLGTSPLCQRQASVHLRPRDRDGAEKQQGWCLDREERPFPPGLRQQTLGTASYLEGLFLWQSHPLLQYGDVWHTQQVPSLLCRCREWSREPSDACDSA